VSLAAVVIFLSSDKSIMMSGVVPSLSVSVKTIVAAL